MSHGSGQACSIVTAALPQGFLASGSRCGIKASGRTDLALLVSELPASAAGVFTQNRVCGAPVTVSRQRVPSGNIRGVVINSGNSNAATGQTGIENARRMTAGVAELMSCDAAQILVCSTGVIGVPLPMDIILAGLPHAVNSLQPTETALRDAATAMMTTDTFAKLVSRDIRLQEKVVRVSGVAKGAAMIAPNMATMLSVIMTDAALSMEQCDAVLRAAVETTFNCISVDGHTSTSDTVLLLANGASGGAVDEIGLSSLQAAVTEVCEKLATDIIRDAEGADHFVTIDVRGFVTRDAAVRVARAVAESALVKTAIVGADPNWGRIVSAAGYAGVDFDPGRLTLRINGTIVYADGVPQSFSAEDVSAGLKQQRDVHLELALSGGPAAGTESVRFWTSDLTAEYVRLNSEYTT